MIRSALRLVGAVTDLVQPPKALLTDPGFRAAQLNEVEAANDGLDPQLFKCYADSCGCQDDDRYAPRECDLCQRLHGEHPTARIACGTTGCPNSSYPSAPGLGGLVERTTPEEVTDSPASSGASTSTAAGGGTASVGNQPLPGAVATPGAGQPLDREAHDALHEAANELDLRAKYSTEWADYGRLIALAAEIRDLAHQFEADAQAEGA